MAEVYGSIGTSKSLSMRLGQILLSVGAILFMAFDTQFYRYTVFCYMVTIMALTIPWSLALGIVDFYYLLHNHQLRKRRIILMISIGDWVVSALQLAAAASTWGVVDFLGSDKTFCSVRICSIYQISTAFAFCAWLLSLSSSVFNLFLLSSL